MIISSLPIAVMRSISFCLFSVTMPPCLSCFISHAKGGLYRCRYPKICIFRYINKTEKILTSQKFQNIFLFKKIFTEIVGQWLNLCNVYMISLCFQLFLYFFDKVHKLPFFSCTGYGMLLYIRLCYVSGLLALVRVAALWGHFIFSGLHTLPFYGSPYMADGIVYGSCGCQIAR